MAIHPLGNLNIAGSSRDRAIIAATLDRMHEKGTQAWVGYSFSWFACLAARAGRAEQALTYLRDYTIWDEYVDQGNTIPEPSSAISLLVGVLFVVSRRRRRA